MNKQRYNEIIDEVYSKFLKESVPHDRQENRDEFVERIKTDGEFAERWGLKLFDEELFHWYDLTEQYFNTFNDKALNGSIDEMVYNSNIASNWKKEMDHFKSKMDEGYTRRIRIVYNNEMDEFYEKDV